MNKNHTCKILAIGIIVLLFGISFVTSGVETNTYIEEEIIETPEVVSSDTYSEIISFISGSCCDFITNGGFIIQSVEISACDDQTWLDVWGYRFTHSGYIVRYGIYGIPNVIASKFIGYSIHTHPQYMAVRGIAFGDIDWS